MVCANTVCAIQFCQALPVQAPKWRLKFVTLAGALERDLHDSTASSGGSFPFVLGTQNPQGLTHGLQISSLQLISPISRIWESDH